MLRKEMSEIRFLLRQCEDCLQQKEMKESARSMSSTEDRTREGTGNCPVAQDSFSGKRTDHDVLPEP